MIKQLYKSTVFTLAALFTAACSSDSEPMAPDSPAEEKVNVSFSISAANEAVGRADTGMPDIDRLVCAVYDIRGNLLPEFGTNPEGQIVLDVESFPIDLNLTLVKNQQYNVVAWAQNSECEAYDTSDLSDITVDYSKISLSDLKAEAFSCSEVFTAVTNGSRRIVLNRPLGHMELLIHPDSYAAAVESYGPVESVSLSGTWPEGSINAVADEPMFGNRKESAFEPSELSSRRSFASLGDGYETPAEGFVVLASAFFVAPREAYIADDMELNVQFSNQKICKIAIKNTPLQRNWNTNVLITRLEAEDGD